MLNPNDEYLILTPLHIHTAFMLSLLLAPNLFKVKVSGSAQQQKIGSFVHLALVHYLI